MARHHRRWCTAAGMAPLAAALALAMSSACAQTPPTDQAGVIAHRLDALSKLVGRYSSATKTLGAGVLAESLKGSAARPGALGADHSFVGGIVGRRLDEALGGQARSADAAAFLLEEAASQARSSDMAATNERLASIAAPQVVVDLFTTTVDGETLPPPPHLEGVAPPSYTLGDFVVGPGSNATVAYPSVASINYRFGGLGSSTTCTGTLIAPDRVLTAAHCFCDRAMAKTATACRAATYLRQAERLPALDPTYDSVFFQDVGTRSVKRIEVDPAYANPVSDLAVLELSAPVAEVAPAPLATGPSAQVLPLSVVVGFGQHGRIGDRDRPGGPQTPLANSQGIKMYAYVRPEPCKDAGARAGLVCWSAVRTAGGEALGTTCHGDSGGPLFTKSKGRWSVTGVTSSGPNDCGLGGRDTAARQYVDVSVAANSGWLERFARPAGAPAPHGTPFVADAGARVYDARYRVFFDAFDEWSDTFILPEGRPRLSVAVNGNPTFSKLGVALSPPHAGSATCRSSTRDSVVVCEVDRPEAGKWRLAVSGSRPQETQVVGTVGP